jgi:hypothetical protein
MISAQKSKWKRNVSPRETAKNFRVIIHQLGASLKPEHDAVEVKLDSTALKILEEVETLIGLRTLSPAMTQRRVNFHDSPHRSGKFKLLKDAQTSNR